MVEFLVNLSDMNRIEIILCDDTWAPLLRLKNEHSRMKLLRKWLRKKGYKSTNFLLRTMWGKVVLKNEIPTKLKLSMKQAADVNKH